MLRIVILPAAVSPANIISQKPGGFYITFRKGKYHSGQSPEYHFVHRYSEHRVLSPIIQYRSVFESYKRRQHKFCTAFLLMEPLHKRPPAVIQVLRKNISPHLRQTIFVWPQPAGTICTALQAGQRKKRLLRPRCSACRGACAAKNERIGAFMPASARRLRAPPAECRRS